ncbi:hypothetical protein Micbo1qcDRAFT_198937 [Microdochium bolleyi]|uniref:Uncharacterized protein n=1 Tax=Microdochium bolleyi TaxID=196109 RepID=A0A136IJR6_9PEZI|nr:hypothetical protein Micbo1qcDRAFT_198937 [Microdochium bolleyi]
MTTEHSIPTSRTISCAESIAALCVLHGNNDKAVLPRPPRNVPLAIHQRSDGYLLSFEEETRLARNMAFLAYVRDDPKCIPAVCVEQDHGQNALRVRVATNTGTILLGAAVEGLQGIFDIMARRNGTCYPFLDHAGLACVMFCLQRLKMLRTRSSAAEFGLHCREVRKRITQWQQFPSTSSLALIIMAIHKLQTEVGVEILLDGLTHQALSKDAKGSIINKISKLSRYYEISRYLSRRCSKDEVFRHLTALRVSLPEPIVALEPHLPGTFRAGVGFTDVLRQAGLPQGNEQETMNTVNEVFQEQVSNISKHAKVHAEIKLLCFYELNRDTIPLLPRAVCSSKDACWLCNALIDAHGEMYTPRRLVKVGSSHDGVDCQIATSNFGERAKHTAPSAATQLLPSSRKHTLSAEVVVVNRTSALKQVNRTQSAWSRV